MKTSEILKVRAIDGFDQNGFVIGQPFEFKKLKSNKRKYENAAKNLGYDVETYVAEKDTYTDSDMICLFVGDNNFNTAGWYHFSIYDVQYIR